MAKKVNIMWFRRDLRLDDNAALFHALKSENPVLPIFIFDKNILDQLDDKEDARVQFIYNALEDMQEKLVDKGSSLEVYYGIPKNVFKDLIKKYDIEAVFTNHDYEPYALERDEEIEQLLKAKDISFHTYKDQVIFEKDEVLKDNGEPYTVYTPYSKKWKEKLTDDALAPFYTENHYDNFYQQKPKQFPTLKSMGFKEVKMDFPTSVIRKERIEDYDKTRDYPALEKGTTRAGVHLRFGTISIRKLMAKALELNKTFANELIWREFYMMILWHFPKVGKGHAFKKEYDDIKWLNDEKQFEAWCEGKTGYPIVDAGMRQLNREGYMHNRVRMITASFLAKHLLIDWRWGEAYFASKLLDFELASNNGGWQWSAGSGCDAAPYFRVFNPTLQEEKFDKDGEYIKKYVPEVGTDKYPEPIVEHKFARERALKAYAKAVKKS